MVVTMHDQAVHRTQMDIARQLKRIADVLEKIVEMAEEDQS